jgi:glycosyltransferase involved in cell wall biosynthesis
MTDVTIVVATHDRPEMLEVELHSILASAATVKPRGIETRVIVVDDASATMAARDIAARLEVDYVRRPTNGGVAQTLVTGFDLVDSPYYSLWGDDDYMLPRWFALHLDAIEQGYDVVAASYWKTDAALRPMKQVTLQPVRLADLRAGQVWANDQSLVRRSALEGIRWRPERERAMLMTMWLALASAGRKFTSLDEPTWLYRRHATNLSNQLTEHDMSLRLEAMAEYAA